MKTDNPKPPKAARQASRDVTSDSFKRLPAMLMRKEFKDISGLNDGDLDAMTITANQLSAAELVKVRAAGLLPVLRPGGPGGHGKYYKEDLGKLLGYA